MDKSTVKTALENIYSVRENLIRTGTFLDGVGVNIIFEQTSVREMCLSTDEGFATFCEPVFFDEWESYAPYVEAINRRFGTTCDRGARRLLLRFRRNDMTLTEAVSRLRAAMTLVAGLDRYTFV